MDKVCGRLTVCFEEPFWVGFFERIEDGKLSVAKVIFGSEPKAYDVYELVLKHYCDSHFSPAVVANFKVINEKTGNARASCVKKVQRQARVACFRVQCPIS